MSRPAGLLRRLLAAADGLPGRPAATYHHPAGLAGEAYDALVTTTPAPPPYGKSWRRHAALVKAMPAGPVDLLLLGDSLAECWPAAAWAPWTVFNDGIGADRTQYVLWRLLAPELARISPRRVLLTIGTNNLASGDTAPAIVAGIEAVAREVGALWPAARVLALAVPPCGPGFAFNAETRRAANALLARRGLVAILNADRVLTGGASGPSPSYLEDNIHFSDSGYALLTDLVRRALGG